MNADAVLVPVEKEPASPEARARVREEVVLMAEIKAAVDRGDVDGVIRRAELLAWVHYGPHF